MEITTGRYRARMLPLGEARDGLALRGQVFRSGACDGDAFDAAAGHLLVEAEGRVQAYARLTLLRGADILNGYSAQFYDLSAFARHFPTALEVGRICLDPAADDPDLPRLMLAVLARRVQAEHAAALFGCASFPADGTGMGRLARHIAPPVWAPGRKARETQPLPETPGHLPPLMRSYLRLGAGVSDHAVVDRDLGTLHVFTALPIASIPPGRARLLTGMLATA